MFSFIAGAVNNDNGINAAAALSLYLLIRGLRRGLSWRLALALGATLAITPLMKKTGYEIYPPAAVGVLGLLWRNRRLRDTRAWAALAGAVRRCAGGLDTDLKPIVYPSTVAGQHAAPPAAAVTGATQPGGAHARTLRGLPVGAVPAQAVVHERVVPAGMAVLPGLCAAGMGVIWLVRL